MLSSPCAGDGCLNHASREWWMRPETSHPTSRVSSGRPVITVAHSGVTAHLTAGHRGSGAAGGRACRLEVPPAPTSQIPGVWASPPAVGRTQACSQGDASPAEKSSPVSARKHLSCVCLCASTGRGMRTVSICSWKTAVQVLGLLLMVSINSSL